MATTPFKTYSNQRLNPVIEPDDHGMLNVNLVPSSSFVRGTVLGELTATPGTFKAYASGNTDGSQIPKLILAYDCQTNAASLISLTGQAGQVGNEYGFTETSVAAYYHGAFAISDLTGLDANAVTVLNATIISGSLASGTGIVRIG